MSRYPWDNDDNDNRFAQSLLCLNYCIDVYVKHQSLTISGSGAAGHVAGGRKRSLGTAIVKE